MKKKLYLIILGMLLAFVLAACGKDTDTAKEPEQKPATETPAGTEEPGEPGEPNDPGEPGNQGEPNEPGVPLQPDKPGSREPDNYDFAIRVEINPSFLLYVAGNEVIAYEALNEDAKKIEDRCAIVNRGIDGALEDIVRFSHEEGYLKDGGEVNVTLVNANAPESAAEEVMKRAEDAVRETASRNNFAAEPKVEVNDSVVFTEPDPNEPGPDPNEPGSDPNEPGPDPNEPGPDPNEPGGEPRKEEGCSVCQGTGDCERCDATGLVPCIRCGATGKDSGGKCPDCNGTGKAVCEQCHGTLKCPACNGTGKKPDD